MKVEYEGTTIKADSRASSILWSGLMRAVLEFKTQTGLDISSVEFEYVEGFNCRDAIQCKVMILPIRRPNVKK